MNKLLIGAAAIGAMLSVAAPAQARDGCGAGFHRGPHGHCRPNGGPGYGPPPRGRPGLVIGTYYPGHGYWYNGRYWRHRYRWHNDWRYR